MTTSVHLFCGFSGQSPARRLGGSGQVSMTKSVSKGASIRPLKACKNSDFNYMVEVKESELRALIALVDRSGYTRYPRNSLDSYKTQPNHIEEQLKNREKFLARQKFYLNTRGAFPFFPADLPDDTYLKAPCFSQNVNKDLFDNYYGSIIPQILSKVNVKEWTKSTSEKDINLLQSLSIAICSWEELADNAMSIEPEVFQHSIVESDRSKLYSLLSMRDSELRSHLKSNEIFYTKLLRKVKVQRLPKHYAFTDFIMNDILPKKKEIAIEQLLGH